MKNLKRLIVSIVLTVVGIFGGGLFAIANSLNILSAELSDNNAPANITCGVILFVLLGVVFDMIGVAVTASDEKPIHSMNARKVRGADVATVFKKNADKVSSFCNDVVGDVCGIISGSAGVVIAASLTKIIKIEPLYISLIGTALIAALTIGGKALGKGIAIKNSNNILFTLKTYS